MEYSIACSNVYYLITNMEESQIKKIPKKLLELICILKIDDYISAIDLNKPLEEQELPETTIGLISLIYNKYLATEQEKEEYKQKCEQYTEQQKNLQSIQFKKISNKSGKEEQTALVKHQQKDSLFSRIIEKIKNMFK